MSLSKLKKDNIMTFVNVKPGKKVRRSHNAFDNIFNEIMNTSFNELSKNHLVSNKPAVNVIEATDHFKIELSAPGLSKEDFKIDIEKDILTIEANKTIEAVEGQKVIKREFNFNKFKRTFRLPETIDTKSIEANFVNGILNLTLAKKEEAKEQAPRSIEIK